MEDIECFHLLARTDELDRFVDHRADGERRTTTCITVEFGQYHAVKVQTVVELLGGVDGILTGHRIDYEEDLGRLDGLLDSSDLVHHLLVDRQTTGGIDDYDIVSEFTCLGDCILGFLNGVLLLFGRINLGVDLLTQYP